MTPQKTQTQDREKLVDLWVQRAVRVYSQSDIELKKYCMIAATVMGKYSHGGTQAIANGIQRSVSTVENHAHAFSLMRDLRRGGFRIRIRTLWRSLPASHWWQAWGIHKAGYDALYYLDNAAKNKWSGRVMMDEYKRELEAGYAPMIFRRAAIALRGLVDELLLKHNHRLSEGQRIALLSIQDEFMETE